MTPSPTLPTSGPSQGFLINTNATVKLGSINTITEKEQHNVGFFFFKLTIKYMLGNVYINKIHARRCLYKIHARRSLCYKEGCSHTFNFLVVFQRNLSRLMEQLTIDSYMLLCKLKNSISIN